jgi:DNA-3-methyladenine glycosylase
MKMKTRSYRPTGRKFYGRPTEIVARELLGHILVRILDDGTTLAGRIVETEAYLGEGDPASHSARRMTDVTRHLWGPPGVAYIYLCMGMYHCLNVVAEPTGRAGCVLLRAVEPIEGIEQMRARRPKAKKETDLCSGPGKLCEAFDLDTRLNGADMTSGCLFIARGRKGAPVLAVSPRIGIRKAADWPLRFYIPGNAHVSRAKPGAPRPLRKRESASPFS